MKKLNVLLITAISLISLISGSGIFAQSPQAFKYQAIARDNTGNVLPNQNIGLKISILQTTPAGTVVYSETHAATTNQFGLFSLEIGTGAIVSGTFSTIDWGADIYFVQIEMDETGGTAYQLMGASQLLSVPYALHAKTAETVTETDPIFGSSAASGITGTDTINWNNKLDAEADADSTNELQALSFSNDTLFLSDGNYVVMPYDSAIWTKTGDTIYYNSGNVGIGTTSPLGILHVDGGTAQVGNNASHITIKAQDGATNFNGGNIILTPGIGQGTGLDGNVGIGTANPKTSLDIGSKTDGIIIPTGITAERPGLPVVGTMRYNTTLGQPEYYDGTVWRSFAPPKGVGGVVTEVGGYRIHTFLESSTFTANVAMNVDVLVVAGGGSGGNYSTTNANGGGGGGGVIYKTGNTIVSGEYPVTVGRGGGGINFTKSSQGRNGENSVFDTLTAIGGGGGGATAIGPGLAGGSGGGGAWGYPGGASTQGGGGFGNAGGACNQQWTGGGGGGAGSVGVAGNDCPNCNPSGNGGAGYASSISGTTRYYGGGGGGSGNSSERAGDGYDGGGRGFGETSKYGYTEYYRGEVNSITRGSASLDAVPNTGGGGGGNSYWSNNVGMYTGSGMGGSGIVIIRYLIP